MAVSVYTTKENIQVKDFLIDTEVLITLTLVDDFDFPSQETEIRRNFLSRSEKTLTINGEKVAVKAFDLELKKRLFQSKVEKPTLRQIISKNIRDEKNKMINIVRVLNHYTSEGQYEALFLFWLGIDTDSHNEKERLTAEKTREENYQKRLRKEGELSLTEQQLNLVNSKIADLQKHQINYMVKNTC